jgi:hypothetical protein
VITNFRTNAKIHWHFTKCHKVSFRSNFFFSQILFPLPNITILKNLMRFSSLKFGLFFIYFFIIEMLKEKRLMFPDSLNLYNNVSHIIPLFTSI